MIHKLHFIALWLMPFLLVSCQAPGEKIHLKAISYSTIPTWQSDSHAEALKVFERSCAKPKYTKSQIAHHISTQDWEAVCDQASQLENRSHKSARQFFETYFKPHLLTSDARTEGRLTGYYIPVMEGSLTQTDEYRYPVHMPPPDMERPYFTRAEIAQGALDGKGLEVAWFKDSIQPFFMEIQGSGRIRLPNGQLADLRYADKNGHGYTPIGKTLLQQKELTLENISMQSIRQWLYDNPDRAQEVMNTNESYVFFNQTPAETLPVGAQGVPLTPERSLAIDASVLSYGLPVYIETISHNDQDRTKFFAKLLITQDRGGAIKGPLRGDLFFGQGEEAEVRAGKQNAKGRWIVLIPSLPKERL